MRFASVDLGTNTFRLLVAEEREPGVLAEVELAQRVVRLGEGVTHAGVLAPAALARAEACLIDFAGRMASHDATHRVGALTAAGRAAADGGSFRERAESLLGAKLFVPSGEEEARLSYRGCRALLPSGEEEGDAFFLDIGGGSTEALFASRGEAPLALSLPSGVVGLSEALQVKDPPTPGDLALLTTRVQEILSPVARVARRGGWPGRFATGRALFLATAGTPLTVAAHLGRRNVEDTRALNGTPVAVTDLEELFVEWTKLSTRELARLPAVAEGREDVILAGLVFLRETLSVLGAERFVTGDGGVLEGVLLAEVERLRGHARWGG